MISSYVVIRLKVDQQKSNLFHKGGQNKFPMSSKDTCKLLALLAGFMFLLGLSWIILLFTVVGADTNIYAAFAIQWLFVFFNSLQGFFLFVFFVAFNRDARDLWFNFLCSYVKRRKSSYSSRIKHSSVSGNTASTKLSVSQKDFTSDTLNAAVKKHKMNDEESVADNYASTKNETDIDDAPDVLVNPINSSGEDDITVKTISKESSQVQIKCSSTICKTVETAEVVSDASHSEDEETSM